jgi:hypothetical protein
MKHNWFTFLFRLIIVGVFVSLLLTSCSTPKYARDCKGVRHTKQKGGFYL